MIVVTAGRGSVQDSKTTDFLQEAAIKVPLLIHGGDLIANEVTETVSTMDIAQTLYELAAGKPPQRVQGTSLISNPPRGWSLSRMRHPNFPHQTALRSENWKLIVTHGADDATGLFDLNADPAEAHNLANSPGHEDRLETMLDLMIDARVALEDRLEPRIAKF